MDKEGGGEGGIGGGGEGGRGGGGEGARAGKIEDMGPEEEEMQLISK